MPRHDGRLPNQLRPIQFHPGFAPHAHGSVLVSFGNTKVICSAMIEEGVPNWMKYQKVPGGWLTAEYSLLPYSTLQRKDRDISRGKLDGRSQEIQRLIGRALRAVTDLMVLGPRTLWIDCDVLQADGGTRTASITGAWVAAAIAFENLIQKGVLKESPLKKKVAAISVGVWNGETVLDLDYHEDKDAAVDCNVVMTDDLQFVEIQGAGEEATFSPEELTAMIAHAKHGIQTLVQLQEEALIASRPKPSDSQLQELAGLFGKSAR